MLAAGAITTRIEAGALEAKNHIISMAVTTSIIGFAIAFFSNNIFACLGFSLAITVGLLGFWSSKDLQDTKQFDYDLNKSQSDIEEASKETHAINKNISNLKKISDSFKKTTDHILIILIRTESLIDKLHENQRKEDAVINRKLEKILINIERNARQHAI